MKILKLLLLFSILPTISLADPVSIDIQPKDIGVFTTNKVQQFTAYCTDSEGIRTDCTDLVDWYVEENPLSLQAEEGLLAADTVWIDADTGLATIISSWGRVNISACWPKGCFIPLPPQKPVLPLSAIYDLLLKDFYESSAP